MPDFTHFYSYDERLVPYLARDDVRQLLADFAREAEQAPTRLNGWTVLGHSLVKRPGDETHVPRYRGDEMVVLDLLSHPIARYPYECFPSWQTLNATLAHPLRCFARNVLYVRIPPPWPADVRTFFAWEWKTRGPDRFDRRMKRFFAGEDRFKAQYEDFGRRLLDQGPGFLEFGRRYLEKLYGCIELQLVHIPTSESASEAAPGSKDGSSLPN